MDTFTKNINVLKALIAESKGEYVHFGQEMYRFTKQADVTAEQLEAFEARHHISLPLTFKTFLMSLGACTLFEDERGFAYQFFHPDQWEGFAQEVFEGTGEYLFPEVLLVCYPNGGHQAGFITTKGDAFGTFYADIPPEYWEEDTELMTFADWLNEEITLYE
ncbi:SMI1/KNR4 family protein [Capnocytophaga sp. oral taxon 878]|uniref:SMI1/KNR4 family protein n=1 Tax=Capnocytophaga sp. oral taxon 878 TaxID=1316596 RepID=UPI000D0469A0|nr:SMI1/KNR4 family protein [Capnocytophaga sp. oral taxon 878]AVM51288.1 SMI1/KNR4 family protein [Capnocytophaga sp. oral taxon 878]